MKLTVGKSIAIAMPTIVGTGIGTAGGIALGGNTAGADSSQMAGYGAAAGAAAGGVLSLGLGATILNPSGTAKAITAGAKGIGKAAYESAAVTGGGIINTAMAINKGAGHIASAGNLIAGTAIGKYGGTAIGIGKKLVTTDMRESNILKHKATKLGAGLIVASSVVGGAVSAFDDLNRQRMGQMDSFTYKATPRTPVYEQNAGATGDLVFAMNANRRG